MQRLDETRPYGTITTPWMGDNDELPRAACYEQDGKLFDAHGVEIVVGKQPKKRAVPNPVILEDEVVEEIHAMAADEANADLDDEDDDPGAAPAPPPPAVKDAPMSPRDLLDKANTIAFSKFVMEAKRILGPTCPKGKEAIKIALAEAIAGFEKRQAERGMSWGGVTQAKPTGPPPAPAAAPAAAPTPPAVNGKPGVDLAKWARGRQEYLFADVTKAIRTQHGKQIGGEHARRDAVEFLIEAKVITAAEARKDV